MNLIKTCSCGAPLSEAKFVPPVGKAKFFGLPEGTMGNTNAVFIKVKCPSCGNEYIAEAAPGKRGGTICMGLVMDAGLNKTANETDKPKQPDKKTESAKPADAKATALKERLAKAAAEVKDGYIDLPDE